MALEELFICDRTAGPAPDNRREEGQVSSMGYFWPGEVPCDYSNILQRGEWHCFGL